MKRDGVASLRGLELGGDAHDHGLTPEATGDGPHARAGECRVADDALVRGPGRGALIESPQGMPPAWRMTPSCEGREAER
jgi:hypothetical protein